MFEDTLLKVQVNAHKHVHQMEIFYVLKWFLTGYLRWSNHRGNSRSSSKYSQTCFSNGNIFCLEMVLDRLPALVKSSG